MISCVVFLSRTSGSEYFTVASITRYNFVKYFLKGGGDTEEACQSFTVLQGENSTSFRNCDEWGSTETHISLSNHCGFML